MVNLGKTLEMQVAKRSRRETQWPSAERWQEIRCEAAIASRRTFRPEITNRSLSLESINSLVGKCNATSLGPFPPGTCRLIDIYPGRRFHDGGPAYFATIEYSPLGWPEETGPADEAPVYLVCPADPGARFGEAERHRLQERLERQFLNAQQTSKSVKVMVLEEKVELIRLPPPLPTADLSALFSEPTAPEGATTVNQLRKTFGLPPVPGASERA